ncbi:MULTISPECIES: amino acid ABC transporter substrate-binding protein [unclassified Leptolyngbya]|uniref:amino acid ABC transporter substrate-binding protein n=1 Tax=unclassified Leptolyngbya TaxID=2650499 RepID=UPI0016882042|nr:MULTISPECIES: amino acid ABC transporter substrate-binding protein [unclassified Leptolyngbya]MBD1912663.1 amino acid ABC transporter substrate-binding protein [Leptolyngbya sp. FACHB-8]MBD2154714.1 amino acid ABC transporter substrate-binding protein [Leptolyngbya sp. FACHB-16]
MAKWRSLLFAATLSVITLTGCTSTAPSNSGGAGGEGTTANASAGSRLGAIKSRGKLICGVEGSIPGFSFVDSSGAYSGLDVDICRAVAAAVFDTSENIDEKIEYRNLDSTERFTALAGGEVDMLSRNTTWTSSRDAAGGNGLEFAPTTFFDGQGMMVTKASGITDLEDLAGKSVCVETGTTTELNLADKMRALGVQYNEVKFQDSDATYAAYAEGRCEAVTSDRSQLAARRTTLANPDDHVLLDVTMSKEPLGPVTVNNDSQWFDVVRWVTYGLFQAEEFDISQASVQDAVKSENPEIRRFLGTEGDLGSQLGLSNDYMVKVIAAVGNYGEVYERNVGTGSPLAIDRGLNKLWTEGGLMYSPPFR